MERPGEIEEIQLVAILRTLKLTQDETAEALHQGKKKVGDIENWLKTADLESIEGLFLGHRLRKVVDDRLPEIADLHGGYLIQAGRLTPDDILEHYRDDYFPEPPVSPAQDDRTTANLYQEHQDGMIHLVQRLKDELKPHLSEFRLRSLKDNGPWQVGNGGLVYLRYGLERAEDTETKIMWNYLQQHLRYSSYSWLLEDNEKGINKWKQLGGKELKCRTRLLRNMDRTVVKLTSKSFADPNRVNDTGPLTWFSDSIWAAVLDGLYRTLDYEVKPIEDGLYKAQYGANFIGLTATKEEGQQYAELHKKTMAKYERSRTVRAINRLKRDREIVTKGISEALTKLVVDKHIPGKCDYEFCR